MIRWKNDQGITLVELLASLAILSIVILLVGSVHIFGQKQFINQTESASQGNELRYSLSVISREVRRAESVKWDDDARTLTVDTIQFRYSENRLSRNGETLAENVSDFQAPTNQEQGKVEITITGTQPRQGQSKTYRTTIYLRRRPE